MRRQNKSFSRVLASIKSDILGTIKSVANKELDVKHYMELLYDIDVNENSTFETYMSIIEIENGMPILIDNKEHSYKLNDKSLSIYTLAQIADELANGNFLITEK